MLLAQEYVPDLSEYKDKFMRTPLGLLAQGDFEGLKKDLTTPRYTINDETMFNLGMDLVNPMNKIGGLLGTFVGKGSKLWKQADYNKALKLEQEGATPEQIWKETGTGKFADGQWRQEISDKDAIASQYPREGNMLYLNKYSQELYNKPYGELPFGAKGLGEQREAVSKLANEEMKKYGKVGTTLNHKELYESYPELQNIELQQWIGAREGNYYPQGLSGKEKNPYITIGSEYPEQFKSTLLHELQHGIQTKEGFATGGSPDQIVLTFENLAKQKREEAQKLLDLDQAFGSLSKEQLGSKADEVYSAKDKALKLEEQAKVFDDKAKEAYLDSDKAFDLYKKLAGEAEARLTQRRIPLTDAERRANFPYAYGTDYGLDYPMEELFVQGILK